MKPRPSDLLLLVALLAIAYLVWLHQGQLELLEDDLTTLQAQLRDVAARPVAVTPARAPRAPRQRTTTPKEKK